MDHEDKIYPENVAPSNQKRSPTLIWFSIGNRENDQYPIVKYFVFMPIVVAICGYFYLLFLANKILKLIFVLEAWAYYKIIEQVVKIMQASTGKELFDAFFAQARRMLGI